MGELYDYLLEECKFLGCDTDTSGCENPELALASRVVLAIKAKDDKTADLRRQLAEAQQEAAAAEALLDKLGPVASGDTLTERIKNVIGHYASGIGRWVKGRGHGHS